MKNVDDIYRLSPMQQGLLFHTLGAPGTYVEQVYWSWRGDLDVATLQRAWQRMVERHTPLRTAFFWEGMKDPLQAVRRKVEPTWRLEDWTQVPAEAQEARFAARLEADQREGFNLSAAPLLRFTLVKCGPALTRCMLSYHHLVMDGWSLPVCMRELFLTYDALSRGEEPQLEPARPYRDYIGWLSKQDRDQAERFWRERLAGFRSATPLAADRAAGHGSEVESYGTESLRPGAVLSGRLAAFTRQHQVTLSTLVQGAWALALGRYSGQDDVAFGTVVSGRPPSLPGVDSMLGTFINTQVSRVRLPPDATVLSWLKALQTEQFAARDFEYVSLVDVQGWSDVPRGQPVFESLVIFENLPRRGLAPEMTARLPVEGFARTHARTGYPLSFVVMPDATDLELQLTYDEARFDGATVRRMLGHVATLLQSLLEAPEARLSGLTLLSPEEERQLQQWNDTRAAFAEDTCLPALVQAQARRTPEAVAVLFEDAQLTYAELEARANQLAHHLRSLGAGPGATVGLCVERSIEMVVGLLGVLKAGAAYVPIDPSYPKDRIAFMLADAAPRVLLTQQRLVSQLPATQARLLCLDSDGASVARQPTDAPEVPLTPGHPAYVIYTSGSTGQPKGTLIPHRALANHMAWMVSTFGLGATERVLQKTPLSFDASVWECWASLLVGAPLVLAPLEAHRDPAALVDCVVRQRVSVLQVVPSLLRFMLDEPALPRATHLRWLFCGGEALPLELALRVRAVLPQVQVVNLYGPTETTIDATWAQVSGQEPGTTAPIGRPVANTQVHVLDAGLRPVPVGVPGELFIGGVQLALGYLGRPALTSERFVPDPFSREPGARLYRTGDRARWLPDGTVDFLGRMDFQVKLHGQRIELGEIEAALERHPSVREAVVVAREDVKGQQRLVAYVVLTSREEGSHAPSDLREHLRQHLPEYMVPAAFAVLDALPLGPNGKLDRKALPAPDSAGAEDLNASDFVAPRDETEQKLADIWAQVLGRPRVGVHDNFFDLGGDSIISLQVVARARQAGLSLTPRLLFQHRTVAALAKVAQAARAPREDLGPVQGPVPLTPLQRVFLEQELPRPHHFNQAVLLEVREPLEPALLEKALRHLVEHHDALRLRLTRTAGRWEQHNAPPGALLKLKRVDLSAVPDALRASALDAEATKVQASLDLTEGLLLRAAFFERGPGHTARLLLVAHHLAVDGVSWRVLLEDLEAACLQLRRGGTVALPPRGTSFQAWAQQLQTLARTEALEAQLPVWQAQGALPMAALPTDLPGGTNAQDSARTVTVELEAETTRLIIQEVAAAYRSRVDELLLSSLAQALSRWAGPGALTVALEGHGREELFDGVDVSRTVGWFTSLFPVRLDVPTQATPGEALRTVREALRTLPHKGVGYGLLRHLGRDAVAATLSALPEPWVAFNYLGQLDAQASALFALTQEPSGTSRDMGGVRPRAFEVDAMIVGGKLRVVWTYSESLHTRATLESLAKGHLEALRALVEGRDSADALRYAPLDFPLARLDAATLERLLPPGTPVEDVYPLSPLQQGLLFHAQLSPGSGLYFEQLSWAIRSPLEASALRRAFEAVVAREAVLRTRFVWEGLEQPLQVVAPRVELPWRQLDWRQVPAVEQPARLEAFLQEDRELGFDLGRAPLARLAVIRLGEDSWHCVWSFHHLLLDGWSMGRVLQQLFTAYASTARGQAPRLEPAPAFRDYIGWLQQQDPARSEPWWRQVLAGFTAPTPLPGARPAASGGAVAEAGEQVLALSAEQLGSLQAFARRHELTLGTLAQAAWTLVLSRYSGEEDVLFGVTVSGRPPELPGVEAMVGLFINSLPARFQVEPRAPVVPWLQKVQAQQVDLRQHEHCPLVQVQSWSAVPRGTPLFESLFVFENYPLDAALKERSPGVTVADVRMHERTHYPLVLAVVPGQELRLQLTYDTARYDDATATRLLEHLRLALRGLTTAEGRELRDVTFLPEEERQRLLVEWNATASDAPLDEPLHVLFSRQVARTPEAVALVSGELHLTYSQLEARAHQLAWHLRELGVRPGSRVALFLPRSPELIIGLLAALKAGATYVPIDLHAPVERRELLLQQSGAAALLTFEALARELPAHAMPMVKLDTEASLVGSRPTSAPEAWSSGDSLAYVMFTSGSTGRPKGVCIPHRAVVRLVRGNDFMRFGPQEVFLQLAPAAFDASTLEVWGALLHGARLVLPPPHALSLEEVAGLLRQHSVSSVFLTTALFAQLVQHQPEALASIPQLMAGGEAMPLARAREHLLRMRPGTRFFHVYGPTENTTFSTSQPLAPATPVGDSLPIGRPISNSTAYVLDAAWQPVPVGIPGELYVGGEGLAWGYLEQPALTAERFIPHPFSPTPGARLYRTGDKVCWLPDGSLDFLGRTDFQVKLRGFRIEPGEVEAVLRSVPGVRDAIVVVREDSADDKRLVAYVVASNVTPAELRTHLQQKLPEYMVPAAFVLLDALPLNANAKVDRRALPAPEAPTSSAERFVAPRDATEQQLAAIWAEVL
ncbi:amino acid adenylation domain-containing protein, partial [Corallococcus sp. bb12-1]|uniref:non-ribosomal peptide synthetase n=1 Tax=Corallococcus sp. bb12-1 TaxID=2996784 RepID=UPI00226E226C